MKTNNIKIVISLSSLGISGHVLCDNITISYGDDVVSDSLLCWLDYRYVACFDLPKYDLVYSCNASNTYFYDLVKR